MVLVAAHLCKSKDVLRSSVMGLQESVVVLLEGKQRLDQTLHAETQVQVTRSAVDSSEVLVCVRVARMVADALRSSVQPSHLVQSKQAASANNLSSGRVGTYDGAQMAAA